MAKPKPTLDRIPHGTKRGYAWELDFIKAGLIKETCAACKAANRDYQRQRARQRTGNSSVGYHYTRAKPKIRPDCGTMKGARQHERANPAERLCEACKEVYSAYQRARYHRMKPEGGYGSGRKPRRHVIGYGNCVCRTGVVRKENNGVLLWICLGCEEVWHSQPASQWPPPKLEARYVARNG